MNVFSYAINSMNEKQQRETENKIKFAEQKENRKSYRNFWESDDDNY